MNLSEFMNLKAEMASCDACLQLKTQGVIPACCQEHLDAQMSLKED